MTPEAPFHVVFMAPWTNWQWLTWATPYPTHKAAMEAIRERAEFDPFTLRTVATHVCQSAYQTTEGIHINVHNPCPSQ